MRLATLLLVLALAAPAFAQDPIPDTTAAWRYYPLEVGNVWEYRFFGLTDIPYERRTIERDTLIGGVRYFVQLRTYYDHDFTVVFTDQATIRFDTTAASVVFPGGTPYFPCRFDTPFPGDEPIVCDDGNAIVAGIGPEQTVVIGSGTLVTGVKAFDSVLGGPKLAAGIGDIGSFVCECNGEDRIQYARVGGVEYGAPIILASEPDAPTSGLALTAYPNPTRGGATLELTVPTPQTVMVEAFDALGRCIHAEARAASGSSQITLDSRAWKPGVYLIRVTLADGATATTRLVRR